MRRPRKSHSELDDAKVETPRDKEEVRFEPDPSEVRRLRIERLESTTTPCTSAPTLNMASESHATLPGASSSSGHRRRKDQHRRSEETTRRRRRESTAKDGPAYVYEGPTDRSQSSHITVSETRRLGRDGESSESDEDAPTQSDPVDTKPRKRKTRVVYVTEETRSSGIKQRRSKDDQDLVRTKHVEGYVRKSRVRQSRRGSVAEAASASPPRRYCLRYIGFST
jgi:hypothetical protein